MDFIKKIEEFNMTGFEFYYIFASVICGLIYIFLRIAKHSKLSTYAATKKAEDWLSYILIAALIVLTLLFS